MYKKAIDLGILILLLLLFRRSVMSDSLQPHRLQHTRLCPSPTPRAYSDSCPLSPWCHPTISPSVVLFSSCLQSFPASGSFLMIVLYMYMYKATVSGIPIFIYVYKTYCSGEVSLLFDSDLQLIGWGPPTFWRPICFTQPTNKNVTLIQKHPHRDIQNNAWPTIWVPWPSQVEAYSHHRLFLV